ncbi:MAG TPA: hypothetical protein ENI87_08110 [bacterium]|nr:hypothetical protein [bacterium]
MSGEAFAIERLSENPHLEYEEIRQEAEAAGITMQPIQYGRARRRLGLTGTPASGTPASSSPSPNASPGVISAPSAPPAPAAIAPPAPAPAPAVPSFSTPTPPPEPQPAPVLRTPNLKKSSPAFEFLVKSLQMEPTLAYGELKARADAQGLKIAPIMYGRAKALLGLVPVAPRGQGKNRKKARTIDIGSLPPAEANSAEQFQQQLERVRDVDTLIAIARKLDEERRRLRALLQQISDSIHGNISSS